MYKDKEAMWKDPETNLVVSVQPIRCAEDVPQYNVKYAKLFEVLWDSMLIQQTGGK